MSLYRLAFVGLLSVSCAAVKPNRDPTGELFPRVEGRFLTKAPATVPDALEKPAIVLLGYKQNAQFDIDRWILGLSQLGSTLPLYEVPTIEGLVPGLIANRIDSGMRGGIPEEDWTAVITVYGDAEVLTGWTGTEFPNNARVLLIDREGRVRWFHDRGYSARMVERLAATAKILRAEAAPAAE